jgi:hypothetical protein
LIRIIGVLPTLSTTLSKVFPSGMAIRALL